MHQLATGANPTDLTLGLGVKFIGCPRREVGQSVCLEVAPDILSRVKLWCVWRQQHEFKSGVFSNERLDLLGSVGEQSVPDDDDGASNIEKKLLQEGHTARGIQVFVGRQEPEVHPRLPARGPRAECRDSSDLVVATPLAPDNRSSADRRPGPPHKRAHHEPALVGKGNDGLSLTRFF